MKFTVMPHPWPDTITELEAAGHEYTELLDQAQAVVFNGQPADVPDPWPESVQVVQAVFAGVETLNDAGVFGRKGPRWANAAGLYADTVAESTMALLLAQLHMLKTAVTAASFSVMDTIDKNKQWLFEDKTVAILGAGGIGKRLVELLAPFRPHIIAVNRSGSAIEGAHETLAMSEADDVWGRADYFVLLTPVTDETRGLVNKDVLGRMKPNAVVVNVGRGPLIKTDDLYEALRDGVIAGAALDVTDPEPLPDDHPLWALDNCLITPHVANTPSMVRSLTASQAVRNFAAFEAGEKMPTEVNPEVGY